MCKLKRILAAFTAASVLTAALPQFAIPVFAENIESPSVLNTELADVMLPATAVGTTAPLSLLSDAAEVIIADAAVPLADNAFGTLKYEVRTGSDVVSVDSAGNVTILKPGSATIAVWAEENDNYLKSDEKIVTINVAKDKLAITVPSNASVVYGTASFANQVVLKSTANASATLANTSVKYTSNNTNVAVINSTTGVITPKNAGTATITVSSEANTYYEASSATYTFTVTRKAPTLSLSGYSTSYNVGDLPFTISKSYNGDGTISYSSSNTNVLDVNTSTGAVTIKGAGTATITATASAGTNYSATSAATSVITVGKMPAVNTSSLLTGFTNTINYNPSNTSIVLGSTGYAASISTPTTGAVAPTGSFTYSIKSGGTNTCGATISGTTLTYTKAGTVDIVAAYSGDSNYSGSTVACKLTVNKISQVFNPVANITKTYGDITHSLAGHATLSLGNGTITYSVISESPNKSGATVVSLVDDVMTLGEAGTATIRATASGTDQYNQAYTDFTLVINRADSHIAANNISKTYLDSDFSLVGHAISVHSETPLVYSTTSDVISISPDYTVTINKSGDALVTVTQAQSPNYNDCDYTFNIHVDRAVPIFTVAPYTMTFNDSDLDIITLFNSVDGFTSNSDGEYIVALAASSATDVVSISGTTVHILNTGTVTLEVSQALTDRFEATQVLSFELTVNPDQAEVVGTTRYDKVATDANFNLDASTTSTCSIVYESSNPEVATVSTTGEVDILTAGDTTITVTLVGNRNYIGTSMSVLIHVIRDTPTLTGDDLNLEVISPNVDMLMHMSYNGDGAFYYSGYDSNVISVENNILKVLHAGSTNLTITSTETPVWNSVSKTIHVFVDKSHPDETDEDNISCDADPDMDYKIEKTYEDPDFDLGFSTRSDGAVSYASSNTYVATISDTGTITLDHAGETTITVTVAETADWYEGVIEYTLKVNKCSVRFNAPAQLDLVCKTPMQAIGATWNSDSTYHYDVADSTIATVSQDGMITAGKFGETTLKITLDLNDRYLAGEITIPVYVSRADPNLHSEIESLEQTGSITKNYGDIDFKLMMTTYSDAPITYVSSDDEIATVSATGRVHIVDIGTVQITASVAQTDYYNAAIRTYTVIVDKTLPVITGADSNADTIIKYVSDPDFKVGINFTNTESVISYSIADQSIAGISADGVVSLRTPGETVITVSAAETEHYSAYEKQITLIVKPQLLGFIGVDANSISLKMGDRDKQLAVSIDYTNADTIVDIPIHFESLNQDICTVTDDGKVTAVGVGKGYIKVSSEEVLPYGADSKLIPVTVSLADLEYSLSSLVTVKLGTVVNIAPIVMSSGASDIQFAYNVENSGILTIDENGNITPMTVGDTIVTVSSQDTSYYAGISKNVRVTVTKNSPSILVDSTSMSITMCDKDVPLNVAIDPVSSYGTNLSLSYESLNPDIVTVNSLGEINPVSVGQGFIKVKSSSSEIFDAVEITIKVTVTRAELSYVLDNDVRIAINVTDKSIEPVVLSAGRDFEFAYTVRDTSVLAVTENGIIVPKKPGSTLVEIYSVSDSVYKGISETVKVTITKRTPVIQNGSTSRIDLNLGDPPFLPIIITDDPGDQFELISQDSSIAEVLDDGTVKPVGIGSTDIVVIISKPSQEGEPDTTDELIVHIPVTITGNEYFVYGSDSEAIVLYTTDKNKPLDIVVSSGSVKPDLTYEVLNQNVASVTPDGMISAEGLGTTILRVVIKAKEQYSEKTLEIPVTVKLADVKFILPENITAEFGDPAASVKPILLDGTEPAFKYTSSNDKVASVDSAGNVTFVGVGTAAITISSAATTMYEEINEVVYVVVKKGDPLLVVTDIVMLESDDPVNIVVSAKSDGAISYSTASTDVITITDKISAVAPGVAIVTAKIAETELYRAATTTFTVTVNKNKAYDATMLGFIALSEPAFNSPLDLRITVDQFDEIKTLPFIVYYELNDTRVSLYSGTITALADGKTSTDFTVNMGNLVGDVTLYAQIATNYDGFDSMPSDNTLSLNVTIPAPEFTITINDRLSVVDPSQYIMVPITVTVAGISDAVQIPIQLEFDNSVISTGFISASGDTGTIVSQLCGYIPSTVEDGKHTITARIALGAVISGIADSQSLLKDSYDVSVYSPDLGLLLNDLEITPNYTFSYSPSLDSCTVNFKAKTIAENISTLVIDDAVYAVNANETSVDFSLSKGETSDLKITVDSATKSKSVTYYVSIRRMNDSTDAEISFILEDGTIIKPDILDGVPVIDLPTDTSGGTLKIETNDPSAKIISIGDTLVNAQSFEDYIDVPTEEDLQMDIIIEADDETVQDTLHLIITSINYEPYVTVQNASEIAGTTYGSHGVKQGRVFTAYDDGITTVEAAMASGKTHGLILALAVSDKNANQYLKGYIEINGVQYTVHWNSFDGPTVLQSKDISMGYIYVDSSVFTADADIAVYPLVVCDYSDSTTLSKISSTSVDVSFGINVFADDFSAYYDEESKTIMLTSADNDISFTYRVSKDSGVTYDPVVAVTGNTIIVTDTGKLIFEITATDSMNNTRVKSINVTVTSDVAEVAAGTNVYASTSRHADYIYINTAKSNSSSVNDAILSIFTESEEVS